MESGERKWGEKVETESRMRSIENFLENEWECGDRKSNEKVDSVKRETGMRREQRTYWEMKFQREVEIENGMMASEL